MTYDFRKHTITRKCDKEYKDYHKYKPYLKEDFKNRCAYCNMHDEWVKPLSFQIDHFIPRASFQKAGRDDLDSDYQNLMYSCPVCNRLKSDAFTGEIGTDKIQNPFFYNPVDTDYNTIFSRDEMGRIQSQDELGKDMIKRLQLYRPTKQMAWFLDELQLVYNEIGRKLNMESDSPKRQKLECAYNKIGNTLFQKHRFFVHSYDTEKSMKNIQIEQDEGA